MNRIARIRTLVLGCVLAALAAGCGDSNPVSTKESRWVAVALPEGLERTAFADIAFHDAHGLLVGREYPPASGPQTPVVLETTGGGWTRINPAGLTDSDLLVAVTFTAAGDAILGGLNLADSKAVILDERGGWNRVSLDVVGEVLALADGGGVVRAVGYSSTQGLALVSTSTDEWNAEDAGFVTTQPDHKDLVDIAWHAGTFYACGFDNAADGSSQEPRRVVVQNDGSGWVRIPSPVEVPPWELRAIALNGRGDLLVGGALFDVSADEANRYVAAMMVRVGAETWSPVALPWARDLDQVNDILVTRTGMIYLACGIESVHILKGTLERGFHDEGPGTPGMVVHLAEGPDGTIYAVGYDLVALGAPIFLRRVL